MQKDVKDIADLLKPDVRIIFDPGLSNILRRLKGGLT
jgi:hypothetical protein